MLEKKKEESVKMTVSPVIRQDGRQKIFVQFEKGSNKAEAIIPGCVFISNTGFGDDELDELKAWLKERQSEVLEQAKALSVMKAFLGEDPHKSRIK